MACLLCGCERRVQRCKGLRKLLPRSDLPGAQQKTPCNLNRYVLLLIYILGVGCTGPVFFNWPPLAELFFQNGAFINLCKKDPVTGAYTPDLRVRKPRQRPPTSSDGSADSSSTDQSKTTQGNDTEDHTEGGMPYVCDAQEAAVQQLYTLCCAICCCFCGVAGALADICGPRLTSMAGRVLQLVGWLLLAFADTVNALYYVGVALFASGIEAAVLPTISVCRLFPASEGFIITVVGSALSVSYAVPLVMKHLVEACGHTFRTVAICYALACPLTFTFVALFFMPNKSFQHFPVEKLEARTHGWEGGDGGEKGTAAALGSSTEEEETNERENGVGANHSPESGKRVTIDQEGRKRDRTVDKEISIMKERWREGEQRAPEGDAPESETELRQGLGRQREKKEEEKRKKLLLEDAEQKSAETTSWWERSSGSTRREGGSSSSSSVGPWLNNINTHETMVGCGAVELPSKITSNSSKRNNNSRRRCYSGGGTGSGSANRRRFISMDLEARPHAKSCSSYLEGSCNESSFSAVKTSDDASLVKMPALAAECLAPAAVPAAGKKAGRSSEPVQHRGVYDDTCSPRSGDELQMPAERDAQCGAAAAAGVAPLTANASCVSPRISLSYTAVPVLAGLGSADQDPDVLAAPHAASACRRHPSQSPPVVLRAIVDCSVADEPPSSSSGLLSQGAARHDAAADREAFPAGAADGAAFTANDCADAAHLGAVQSSNAQRYRAEQIFAAAVPVEGEPARVLGHNCHRNTGVQEARQRPGGNESIPVAAASCSAERAVESSGSAATSDTLAAAYHVGYTVSATTNSRRSSVAQHMTAVASERKSREQTTLERSGGRPSRRRSRDREAFSRARRVESAAMGEEPRTFVEGVTRCPPPFEGTSFSNTAGDLSPATLSTAVAARRSADIAGSGAAGSQMICCHAGESEQETCGLERAELWHSGDLPSLHHPNVLPYAGARSERTTAEERKGADEESRSNVSSPSDHVAEAREAKQKNGARKCPPDNLGKKDATDRCGRACYQGLCCCCCRCHPLTRAEGSKRRAKWWTQLYNDRLKSALHQLLSERYILIIVYKVVVVLVATYFQQAGHRMFRERVLDVRGMLLPFSFVPCIILGQAADHLGIVRVLFVVNFFGFTSYFFSFFTTYSSVWAYLSVCSFVCYISFYSSQVFIYIETTFMPEHFGKLSGFSLMAGGITSLVAHPLYSYLTVSKHRGNTMPVRIAFTVLLLLLNLLLLRLFILYKRNPQPYRTSAILSEHTNCDKSKKERDVEPTMVETADV